MSRRARNAAIGGALALVAVVAAVGLFALRGADAPPPAALSPATVEREPKPSDEPARGTWAVERGGDSFVGYSVRERLASIGLTTAVGRTREVEGTIEADGERVTAARFETDLRGLRSDEERRDNRIRTQGLESDRFPTSSFELARSALLLPAAGAGPRATRARGRLMLHGVTRPVTVAVRAQRLGRDIEVAGSVPITFADYGIEPPNIAGFVSVAETATMEFRLRLSPR